MGTRVQRKSQADAVSVRFHVAQASAGGHAVGHDVAGARVSHVSHGVSTTPLPQVAAQSASRAALAPGGQQPSPLRKAVVGTKAQRALHVPASSNRSSVQGCASVQLFGHAPAPLVIPVSQVSPGSTLPSPQVAEQSGSVTFVHPVGQQPSDVVEQALAGATTHVTEQAVAAP